MSYAQALSTAAPAGSVSCRRSHTTQTYAVKTLDTVVDGHLLAATSTRAQAQIAQACPVALATFLGTSADALRLTMLRAVWFTPTTAQEDAGAQWYRCDVVELSGASLAPLTGSLKGALGPNAPATAVSAYAMCGTTKPGASGFQRVPCAAKHTWKAISTVALTPGKKGAYPGQASVKAAGTAPCQKAAQNQAANALDYQWGYDWPSAQQWTGGQTYGICWAPATS